MEEVRITHSTESAMVVETPKSANPKDVFNTLFPGKEVIIRKPPLMDRIIDFLYYLVRRG